MNLTFKQLLFLFLLISSPLFLLSQSLTLEEFNENRLSRQKNAMLVLGTWAVGNIAVGAIGQGFSDGETKQFHIMNAGWNTVNLAIAGFGYYGALNTDPAALDLYSSLQEQQKLQKALLFNAGLDIGYMAAGAYLMERGAHTNPGTKRDRFRGFGKSIILQGGFLFAFDLGTYFVLSSHNEDLRPLFEGLSFTGNAIGWRMTF